MARVPAPAHAATAAAPTGIRPFRLAVDHLVAALPMALTNPRRRTVALRDLADIPVRLPTRKTQPHPGTCRSDRLLAATDRDDLVTHDLIAAAREASSRRLVSATNQSMRPPTCEGKLQR
jgi:hypothetical protein